MKINKFTLNAIGGVYVLDLPLDADVFSVLQDGNGIALYATHNENDEGVARTFALVATGNEMPEDLVGEKLYLGSVSFVHTFEANGVAVIRDTPFELHVWEVNPPDAQGRPALLYPGSENDLLRDAIVTELEREHAILKKRLAELMQ